MTTLYSAYLVQALDVEARPQIIQDCVNFLTPRIDTFDCIAFRGMSGALIAPEVATRLGKGLILVRKDEPSHSVQGVEGSVSETRYIILDDFVRTGSTVRAIYRALCRSYNAESNDDRPTVFAKNPRPLFVLQYNRFCNISDDDSVALYDENDSPFSPVKLLQRRVPLYGCATA